MVSASFEITVAQDGSVSVTAVVAVPKDSDVVVVSERDGGREE